MSPSTFNPPSTFGSPSTFHPQVSLNKEKKLNNKNCSSSIFAVIGHEEGEMTKMASEGNLLNSISSDELDSILLSSIDTNNNEDPTEKKERLNSRLKAAAKRTFQRALSTVSKGNSLKQSHYSFKDSDDTKRQNNLYPSPLRRNNKSAAIDPPEQKYSMTSSLSISTDNQSYLPEDEIKKTNSIFNHIDINSIIAEEESEEEKEDIKYQHTIESERDGMNSPICCAIVDATEEDETKIPGASSMTNINKYNTPAEDDIDNNDIIFDRIMEQHTIDMTNSIVAVETEDKEHEREVHNNKKGGINNSTIKRAPEEGTSPPEASPSMNNIKNNDDSDSDELLQKVVTDHLKQERCGLSALTWLSDASLVKIHSRILNSIKGGGSSISSMKDSYVKYDLEEGRRGYSFGASKSNDDDGDDNYNSPNNRMSDEMSGSSATFSTYEDQNEKYDSIRRKRQLESEKNADNFCDWIQESPPWIKGLFAAFLLFLMISIMLLGSGALFQLIKEDDEIR
mmetsp:Transcript_43064/g.48885  ORF Transcript_43064/g.48885 Transcript_43064/m.48885 type:complete len:509 (+) Transcript_43064:184-1710(+)